MKKWLMASLMVLVFLVVSCAGLSILPSKDVFSEITQIAQKEGVKNGDAYEAARECGEVLIAVVGSPGKGSAILTMDGSLFICLIGYYPGNAGGEYLTGVMQGQFVIGRKVITKQQAEQGATEMLKQYKTGKPITLEEFLAKHKKSNAIEG